MKKNFRVNFLITFVVFVFFACNNDTITPPTTNSNSNILKIEKVSTFTLGTTNSDDPLTISKTKNEMKNELKYTAKTNFSDDGSGSIFFTTNDINNLYLPQYIQINSDNLSYSYEGKSGSTEINSFIREIHKKIKENKETEKEQYNKVKSRIEWSNLSPNEVVQKFKEKGFSIKELGNDLFEVSRSFQPIEGINNMSIKMVFNAKTGVPESSILYRGSEKVFENMIEVKNGKNISYQKTYGKAGLRQGKNFLVVREFEN